MSPVTRAGWRVVAFVSVAALLLAACGDSGDNSGGQAQGQQTYKLAFVGPLTGPNANLGINIRNGATVAVEEANQAGGDVKFQLEEFDTQGDPAQASTQKDRFINDSAIRGVVGPTFSGETRAVIPSLQAAGLVMVSASATATALPTELPGQTVFHRLVPDDDIQGKGVTDYVTKKLTVTRAAYVNDNADYGKALADGTREQLEKAGVTTVLNEVIDPKSQDFSAVINQVRALSPAPDMIFYGGYYSEAGRLKKQLTDAQVNVRFVSGDGSLDVGFVASAGAPAAEGTQVTCACKLATADAPGKLGEFAKAYQTRWNTAPATYSTEGYDAANILIKGLREGHTTRQALLDYVENLGPYEGAGKTIEFEANGNIKAGDVFVYEFKEGKPTVLGTIADLLR
ncbi:MAG: branched-chain amino acid transport system substrate-binding protein [Actinomycetota bacterium]|jgi:branched-chain amino acid transport system substrate-binding protein|nr:branched-chain amino acid transport system substrate-binding protein [Actinomycetota bacterium]